MVAKYLIAGAISAALAGGAVWMAADATELSHPHDTVEKRKDADKTKTGATDGMARETTSHPRNTDTKTKTDDKREDAGSVSMIDRLMSRDVDKEVTARPSRSYGDKEKSAKTRDVKAVPKPAPMSTSPTATSKAKMDRDESDESGRKVWLDDYLSRRNADAVKSTYRSAEDDAPKPEMSADDARESWLARTLERDDEAEDPKRTTREWLDGPMDTGSERKMPGGADKGTSTFVIAPKPGGKTSGDKIKDTRPGEHMMSGTTMKPGTAMNSSKGDGVFALLRDQAAKLEIDTVRDDAHFNIVDYALSEGEFGIAKDVMAEISTDELRDTARTRIAVAYAKHGHMEKAFSLIDQLEIEELADPVRLEIIRAATAPKMAPSTHHRP